MPNAPRRPCPHCGRLTLTTYCKRHQRPSASARGYDTEWAQLAKRWLLAYPWCGQRLGGVFHADHSHCHRRGAEVRAQVVDHIKPIREGGARLDLTNLQSLCARCNARKR